MKTKLEDWFPQDQVVIKRGSRLRQTWGCYFADLPEAVFQVKVKRTGGDPVPVYDNILYNNAAASVSRYLAGAYQEQGGDLGAWQPDQKNEDEDRFVLETTYASRTQAAEAAEQISGFFDWAESQPHSNLLPEASYDFKPEEFLWEPSFSSGQGIRQALGEDSDEVLRACEEKIMEYLTFYCLETQEFSQEELEAYARERWSWKREYMVKQWPSGVYRGEEKLPSELFSGIAIDDRFSAETQKKISYGGLFALLKRLDAEVNGEPKHFSFTGADGAEYELSYDFYRMTTREKYGEWEEVKSWYFLKDGLRWGEMELRLAPAVFVNSLEFEAMTGVRLRERAEED